MNKKNFGYKFIIYSIILLITILIANINSVVSEDQEFNENTNITTDDEFILEYDETVIEKNRNVIVPSDTSVEIKNPKTKFTITPPNGTDIVDYTNKSIHLVMENFDIITIDLENTNSIFTPVNFVSSINGLHQYIFKISYNENYSNPNYKDYFSSYLIDWGNGEQTKGNGSIPSSTQYIYNEAGNYEITINLIDKNGIKYTYAWNQTYKLSAEKYVQLWTIENKEIVAVGSASTIGAVTLLGIAFTEAGKFKLLSLLILAFPMFAKIEKEDVLDHFVRGEIYGYIRAYPGAHYNQIMKELEIKNGTLSYHLYILEKTGIIKSRKENYRYRAFYPIDINFPEEERYRLSELQINIIKLINEKKGINQKNISKTLNEKHQTISYNIKVLQKAGLINTNKKGRKIHCYTNSSNLTNISEI